MHAADGDEYEHDILMRHRHRSLENVLQELSALSEAQIADQHLDEVTVTRITDRLIVQVLYTP